jgi:hypothetical protein
MNTSDADVFADRVLPPPVQSSHAPLILSSPAAAPHPVPQHPSGIPREGPVVAQHEPGLMEKVKGAFHREK